MSNWYPSGTLAAPYLPQEISQVKLAFPGSVGDLLPPADAISEEFKTFNYNKKVDTTKGSPDAWIMFQEKWFAFGLKGADVTPREGIDKETAFRHLAAIQGSFEPKHEYKVAAVAYLASLWFSGWKEHK